VCRVESRIIGLHYWQTFKARFRQVICFLIRFVFCSNLLMPDSTDLREPPRVSAETEAHRGRTMGPGPSRWTRRAVPQMNLLAHIRQKLLVMVNESPSTGARSGFHERRVYSDMIRAIQQGPVPARKCSHVSDDRSVFKGNFPQPEAATRIRSG
jgi:hypothetical protein